LEYGVEAVRFGELVSSKHRQSCVPNGDASRNAKPGADATGRSRPSWVGMADGRSGLLPRPNQKPAGWVARDRLVFYRVSVIPSAPGSVR
jgi:hypothetical protein